MPMNLGIKDFFSVNNSVKKRPILNEIPSTFSQVSSSIISLIKSKPSKKYCFSEPIPILI